MSDELHPVVTLLLKRMESHPEEFGHGVSRWGWMIENVLENCSKEEAEAIKEGLRPIRLQEIHETVMDELLNGDERRRKEQEEQDYERRMMAQQAMRISANGSVGIGSATPSTTLGVTTARYPTHADMEKNSLMNALRNMK